MFYISRILIWLIFFVLITVDAIAQQAMPARYDVLITEFMADPLPQVHLPNNEWVELYNRSDHAWNLEGWRIAAGNNISGQLPSFVLQPDSFVIICTGSALAAMSQLGNARTVTSFPALNNGGDVIALLSSSGAAIHAIGYSDKWYNNELKKNGGWSLEMIDINNPCGSRDNWSASIAATGGTPGHKNSVDAMKPDENPPKLLRTYCETANDIILVFNEPVDSMVAANVLLYKINEGSLIPQKSIAIGPLFDKVKLVLSEPLQPGKVYNIAVSGLADCKGNTISLQANTAKAGLAEMIARFDIVVNEILFDPPAGGTDYVEIYNRSKKIINLSTLYIANRNAAGTVSNILQTSDIPLLIFPGEYRLLSENQDLVRQYFFPGDPSVFMELKLPSYNDDKGNVILLNEQGNIVDEIAYLDDWHFALLGNKEGVALERISYNDTGSALSLQQRNWHSASGSAGYGTPGYKNSQSFTDDNSEQPISIQPAIISPDNDGRDDFAVIEYQFPSPGYVMSLTLFDAAGRRIRDLERNTLCGTRGYFRWDGLGERNQQLLPGLYILFAQIFNLEGKTKRIKKTIIVAK